MSPDSQTASFGSLSGGQQQRVRIAQALASNPDVILLDEPVTGLDIPSQECILDVLDDYSEQGTTVIVTTHHLDEAWRCQKVVLMENKILASGPPRGGNPPDRMRNPPGQRLLGTRSRHQHHHQYLKPGRQSHTHSYSGHALPHHWFGSKGRLTRQSPVRCR